jgi:uncharacterized protein (TIGR02302 family)
VREPRLKIALAWASAGWEKAWRAVWPLATVIGAFLAIAGIDILPDLPGLAHGAILLFLAMAAALAGWRAWRLLRIRDAIGPRRRLERDSGLLHRPLTGLADRQATGTMDPAARGLWAAAQARRAALIPALQPRLPRPGVASVDRFAVRGLVILGLAVAAAVGWNEWDARLWRALNPGLAQAGITLPPGVDVYIAPPAYTGQPPIYLSSAAAPVADAPAVAIPTGSAVTARASHFGQPPVLRIGEEQTAFIPLDADNAEATATVSAGETLAVEQGTTVAAGWAIMVVPDRPPAVVFAEPPAPSERQALRVAWQGTDDYGLETVRATVMLGPGAPAALDPAPLTFDLSVPGRWPRGAKGAAYHDLTPHPWAGQQVRIVLTATDAAGQSGESETATLTLPERDFTHPVARAIAEARRDLTLEPDNAPIIADTLDQLSTRPERYYNDPVVFLALRTAARRIYYARTIGPVIGPLRDLLWDTALRIEDGDVSLAERALREAQRELAEALDRGASDEEIARLTDQLRQALDRYLQALAEQSLNQPRAEGREQSDEMTVSRDELQEMLDRMQELSRSGAQDEARELLSQFQEMLENLKPGPLSEQQMQAQREAMQMLDDVQKLTRAQRDLMDRTYRQGQEQAGRQGQQGRQGSQGQQGQDGTAQAGQAGAEQEAIRRALGELMRRMGETTGDIPAPFGQAEQAMRQAERALGEGQPGEAVGPQGQALDQLQQGLQGLAQGMMQGMAGTQPGEEGRNQGRNMQGQDPLGRPTSQGAANSTEDVGLPTKADRLRARDIVDELRRRLGQPNRPPVERDYIERLLRQF